jgi:SAM-dependent methyltransferase
VGTLLQGLDLRATQGLEIGPLHNPILHKPQCRVLYVDHVGTEALRAKYAGDPHVDPRRIVEVDIVWGGGSLDAACGGRRFDYVVASHVIEHIPDLIGWLQQLKSVLHPSGTVRLIVPDRRYCFDYRRETSSAADMILAARAGIVVPGPRQILDFTLNIAALDLDRAWGAIPLPDPPPRRDEYDHATAVMQHALAHGTYHDVHCWVFTPLAFARLMRQLAAYGLLGFACTQCTATEGGSLDFFVHLMATDDEKLIADSWAWAVDRHAAPEDAEITRLRQELARLRGSWSWRLTKPMRRLAGLPASLRRRHAAMRGGLPV